MVKLKLVVMVKRDIQNIQNIYPEESRRDELINLKEASQLYDYTQHHFGLLCRQGKLKAERVGKKWFTTREWIEKYLSGVEEKYKSTISHYTQQEKVPVKKKLPPISLKRLLPIKLPPTEFIPIIPRTNFLTPLMAGTRLVMGASFVILFVVFLHFGLLRTIAFDYRDFSVKLVNSTQEVANSTFLRGTQKNFSDFSKDMRGFNTGSLFSSSHSFGEILRQFALSTRDNVFAFGADLKQWGAEFKKWAWNYGDSIKLTFSGDNDIAETYVKPAEEETEANEGMVVLPQSDVGADSSQFKRDIQSVFSDNVIVQPDKEGDAGIIQPIFKKNKGDEYLYVMVPVDKE